MTIIGLADQIFSLRNAFKSLIGNNNSYRNSFRAVRSTEMTDRDYKSEWLEQEGQRQAESVTSWIYVGVDTRHPDEAKIGLTGGQLGTRASSPQNPYYTLFRAFKVKDGTSREKLKEIETAIKEMLSANYEPVAHYGSGSFSEVYKVSPQEMTEVVNNYLLKRFGSYILWYYCDQRDIGVIEGWENDKYIRDGVNLSYKPRDLSSPPISLECLTPPGCGDPDCKCW